MRVSRKTGTVAGEAEERWRTASSLMRRSETISSMMGRASSTFISRFSPLLFRDAITRSSRLIISCRGAWTSCSCQFSRHSAHAMQISIAL